MNIKNNMKDEALSNKIRQSKLYYWCVKIIPRSLLLLFALSPFFDENHFLLYAISAIVGCVLLLIEVGSLIYFNNKGLSYKGYFQDILEMTKGDLLICAIGIAAGIYVKSMPHCIDMAVFAGIILSNHLLKNRVNKLKN